MKHAPSANRTDLGDSNFSGCEIAEHGGDIKTALSKAKRIGLDFITCPLRNESLFYARQKKEDVESASDEEEDNSDEEMRDKSRNETSNKDTTNTSNQPMTVMSIDHRFSTLFGQLVESSGWACVRSGARAIIGKSSEMDTETATECVVDWKKI